MIPVLRIAFCCFAVVRSWRLLASGFLAAATAATAQGASPARNAVLFIGDAGGLPTLHAAGIYAHDRPHSLFIHQMPHLALSDASSLDGWVSDSAAGMTAIVAGHKTNNGMVSVLPGATGEAEQPLKTILEYAEERGLATGVVTNMAISDATPAACYAHAASRRSTLEIFEQVFTPRFGDGVDVLIGAGRTSVYRVMNEQNRCADEELRAAGYRVFDHPADITADAPRVASIYDGADFEPEPVIDRVLEVLGRDPEGFFLMVEWDMHADNIDRGMRRTVVMDNLIRRVAGRVPPDTLILFTADHSFDLRMLGGKRSAPFAPQVAATMNVPPPHKPAIRITPGAHSGEDVIVTAQGPGAERVKGFMSNTDLFHVMMSAYGWKESQ
jgi:alkaline phosphatase